MITIIFPYRNREPERIKKSLYSLKTQTNQNFRVLFVDYGSKEKISSVIKELVLSYSFTDYIYNFTELQPWSRAKAINFGLKNSKTDFVFTADIDMIFSPDFISKLHEIKDANKIYYFKVGFLNEFETQINKTFKEYSIQFYSGSDGKGLSLFSKTEAAKISGYDEFLHFWGAEDIDIHNRLKRSGLESLFYDKEVLLLHQWHKSYRKEEKNTLTRDLQLNNVVKLNQQHLVQNDRSEAKSSNNENWGNGVSLDEFKELTNHNTEIILLNKIEVITHFLYCELPNFKNKIVAVKIVQDSFQNSLKYRVKKLMGKTVPKYYSLKEINDMFLLHIISFYHSAPYCYKVHSDLKSITFRIKK